MNIKLIGACLIVLGSGMVGFSVAAGYRREEKSLRNLISALDYMACELQYRATPLPDLCRLAGEESLGSIKAVLSNLSYELDTQICPDVSGCMSAAMASVCEIPSKTAEAFSLLGSSLGRFDIEGQLKGLETVRSFCRRELEALSVNRDNRLRSYQTLGVCAGAALAILFV